MTQPTADGNAERDQARPDHEPDDLRRPQPLDPEHLLLTPIWCSPTAAGGTGLPDAPTMTTSGPDTDFPGSKHPGARRVKGPRADRDIRL
ncbi:hypothetical protein [Amycolatopsis thermoflava]|uniref:hypothetical protein n=1 Tax=Amycolatopsis thermoflava TaxID=84480 RepID=UPI0012F7B8D9|nr:hypothetical protein [Amycolatopsis thermoflava]